MRVHVEGKGGLTLSQTDFVASGGEGRIYARGEVAYKIYDDPSRTIPRGKLNELSAIRDPCVVSPDALLLDQRAVPIGYAMQFVKDTYALCQLFPRSFRERHGVDLAATIDVVRKLRERIDNVHQAGALVVDLNDTNFLVRRDFGELYAIDVDSYQTRSFPAQALSPSIRDYTATRWSPLSDWFSFAIISFQLLCGVHPYRGRHPAMNSLEERMRSHASVFDPKVKLPKAAYPVDVIPERLRDWYRAVLQRGERIAPPDVTGTATYTIATIAASTRLEFERIDDYGAAIRSLSSQHGLLAVETDDALWLDGRRHDLVRGSSVIVTPQHRPVAATHGVALTLQDLSTSWPLEVALAPDEVVRSGARLYARTGGRLVQIQVHEAGNYLVTSPRIIANVLPHATKLFDGVALVDMLGACYASLLEPHGARQVRLGELDGAPIVDAKYERSVLMVVVRKPDANYARHVFRFANERYDLRTVDDITDHTGLNFAVLDTGVCVALDEESRLELFSTKLGAHKLKQLEDDALSPDLRLCAHGCDLHAARGSELYRLSLSRPAPSQTRQSRAGVVRRGA